MSPEHPDADANTDDVKDKFREALQRKRSHEEKRDAEARETAKIHGEHGPAATRRAFRRKSG